MNRKGLTKKTIIWIVICLVCLLVACSASVIRGSLVKRQISQQMAERWNSEGGKAQISCFFSREANVSEMQLISFEHNLDDALKEASIVVDTEEHPGARLWADAYSAQGNVSVASDRTTLYLKALGVGGDFFQFHPQELLYGNYFSGSDVNQDYVVIDREIAWQLFGGIDVAGKTIEVGGKPHVIAGVINRPQGKMEKAAGLSDPLIYVSMQTLQELGGASPIQHYEIVMDNPIKDFAMQKVKELLHVDEKEVEFMENTNRFAMLSSLRLLGKLGYRSMNGKAIIYPYWENLARGYEDILALITLVVVIFFAVPALVLGVWLIGRWRHKKWTLKSLLRKMVSLWERVRVRVSQRKKTASEKKPIRFVFDEEDEDEKE